MSDRPTNLAHAAMATGRAWWAPTMGRMTVKARIATVTVAAALVAVSLVVWTSPTVSQITGTSAEAVQSTPTAKELELAKENAAMLAELKTSRAQANGLRSALADEQAAREKGAADSAAGKAAAQAKKDAAAAAAAAKPKSSTAGKTSTKTTAKTTSASSGSAAANPTNPSQPAGPSAPIDVKPTAPSKAELLDPATRYYGLYTAQAPFSWATYDDSATKLGRNPNLVGYFSGWDKPFRADAVTRAWDRGALPMLTWESQPSDAANDVSVQPKYSLPTITAGAHDEYLRQYARDITALGLPLAIRLDHEMNGVWYPWSETTSSGASINGNSTGDYAAMWQHVHEIFEQEGANAYVIWVWSPNIVNNLPAAKQSLATLEGLYPGDAYVDWVGVSGYFRPAYKPDNDASFAYTYDRTLDQLRAITDKKILLAEVGASEIGGRKPAWVTSFFSAFGEPKNADVIGFGWFNMAVSTYSEGQLITNDWRVDSRRNTLEAFTAGLHAPANNFGGVNLATAPVAAPDPVTAPDTSTATPTPTAAPTASATPTPAPTPTASSAPTASATPAPSASPTSTRNP